MSDLEYQPATYRVQENVGYLIKHAQSLLMNAMERVFRVRGFTFLQFTILSSLRDGVAVNPKDICEHYRHDSGALSRVIDQLAKRRLLQRVRCDRDRRKVQLQLTAAGREAADELMPMAMAVLNKALVEFSDLEVRELQRLVVKLNTNLLTTSRPTCEA